MPPGIRPTARCASRWQKLPSVLAVNEELYAIENFSELLEDELNVKNVRALSVLQKLYRIRSIRIRSN